MTWKRPVALLLLLALAVSACSGERREVITNSGGVLDCRSDTIQYVMMDGSIDSGGAATAAEAVDRIGEDSLRPPGTPTVESLGDDFAVFTFVDESGNRLGRVSVRRHEGGWFAQSIERCG